MIWLLAGILIGVSCVSVSLRIYVRRLELRVARARRERDRRFDRTRRRHSTGFSMQVPTRRWVHIINLTTDELVSADERRRKLHTYLTLFSVVNVALRAQGRRP